MSKPLSVPATLLILISLGLLTANAQISVPGDVPGGLSQQQNEDLNKRRSSLVEQGNALRNQMAFHNAKCSSVPENSPLVEECRSSHDPLVARIREYNRAVDDFNSVTGRMVAERKERQESCEMVARQAQMDRQEIERLVRTNEMSQEELQEWNKLNADAQNEAVIAGAKFVLDKFVADVDSVRNSVSRLERQAAELTQKAVKSRKYSTRLKYLDQLNAALDRLEPLQGNLLDKVVVQKGLDAEKTWSVARDTMRHEFRVARQRNQEIRETLQDGNFKEAFVGADIDTPGLNVLTTLTEQAGEETGKLLVGLDKYERFTGPTVRAATFVRDAWYSALLSYLSTERVLQQTDLAGALARSAGVLQQRYKKSVDALQDCRQSRFSR